EVLGGEAEDDHDDRQADDHGETAEIPALDVLPDASAEALDRNLFAGRHGRGSGRHALAPMPTVIPDTFVGWPAVIAWTTSSWVVDRRSKNPAFRPSRSTQILSAATKTSGGWGERRRPASPCSASRFTSSRTCSVCATPSAAV